MFLKELRIHNYKSLRNVCFNPSPLSVLVGPNASGKSNFASAVHFLSEVYSQGLEVAVARKGGYENIAFRKQRRSKAAIEFEITLEATLHELGLASPEFEEYSTLFFQLTHKFSIVATGSGIKSAFKVRDEACDVVAPPINGLPQRQMFHIERNFKSKELEVNFPAQAPQDVLNKARGVTTALKDIYRAGFFSGQQLVMGTVPFNALFPALSAVSNFDVYQVSTALSRTSGVPTPNPKLSSAGENLPALIDWLQRAHPKEWKIVLSGMRDVLPGLKGISVEYLHTKTLGIFFKEEGVGHSWTADEVSDGTMQALALLTASVDPRTSLLLIEEPENSVHPWILRVIMERLREVSKSKNVIVTSHSPVLINLMKPEEVWVVFRKNSESHLQRLMDLDPTLEESWEQGGYQLSEFLDSGSVSQAVPGGVF